MGITRRILADNASTKAQIWYRSGVSSRVLRHAAHSSRSEKKYVSALESARYKCANVLVSLELFGSSGLKDYLRQVSLALCKDDNCWVKKDICGYDYLAMRLAKVELLLDARDSRLHPGILDVTRRIHEGKSPPGLIMTRKRAHCHSQICQRKTQSSSLRTGDDVKHRTGKQKTIVFRVRRRARQMLELF